MTDKTTASHDAPTIDPRSAVRAALREAAQQMCCGNAACHYEDRGLPCEIAGQTAQQSGFVSAFLRALPDRFPMERPGGVTWGHAKGEMARLAKLLDEVTHGRHR